MKKSVITLIILVLLMGMSLFLMVNCGGGNDISSPIPQATPAYNPLSLPDSDAGLSEHMEGEVIIRYEKGYDPSIIAGEGRVIDTLTLGNNYYARIKLPGGSSVVETIKKLMKTKGVVYAQPDYIIREPEVENYKSPGYIKGSAYFQPNDPDYNTCQYGPQLCNAPQGWAVTQGDPNVVIALLDSGVNGTHEDLKDNMLDGYDFTGEINPDPNGGPISGNINSDTVGHGTHVAGIAAARGNNGKGMAGIAWNCKIMPVKVLDEYNSTTLWIACKGVNFAVNPSDPVYGLVNPPPKANIINMSIGFSTFPFTFILNDALAYAVNNNIVVVTTMGNDSNTLIEIPASCSSVIATGAIDGTDSCANFSTKGFYISMAAPGVSIYSTYYTSDNDYEYMPGTSMAAPFISGVCALIISTHPELNIHYNPSAAFVPEKIKSHLENTATDIGTPGWDIETGYGKPDTGKAVTLSTITNKYGRLEIHTNLLPDPNTVGPTGFAVLYDSQNNMANTGWIGEEGNINFYNLKRDTYRVVVTEVSTETVQEQTGIIVTPGSTAGPVTINF